MSDDAETLARKHRAEGLREAVQIAENFAANAERRAATHDNPEAKAAALDKMEAALLIKLDIMARANRIERGEA